MLGNSVNRLLIIHRLLINPDDVVLPTAWNKLKTSQIKPSDEQIVKQVYKEAGNVIEWAHSHGLKLEIEQQYNYRLDQHDIIVYARVNDPEHRLILELSKPDPIKEYG